MKTYTSLGVGVFALVFVVVTLQDSCMMCRVVMLLFSIIMTTFNWQAFVLNPSWEQIEKCRKDELVAIANHYQIAVGKQALKSEIKSLVVGHWWSLKFWRSLVMTVRAWDNLLRRRGLLFP